MEGGRLRSNHDINDHRSRSRLRVFEPGDLRSIHSEQLGNYSNPNWIRGQEFSPLGPYDPVEDADDGKKRFSERKQLYLHQVFRYADVFDWILMIVGLILAVGNSLFAPFLFYCAGIALQDIVVYERCEPQVNSTTGVCNINGYCGHTFEEVGRIFLRIVGFGWIFYIGIQLVYNACFTIAADRQTKKIRAAYFESIVMKDMAWFDLNADRDFAKAMTEEVTHIRLGTGDVIPSFLNLVCTILLMIAIVFTVNFKVALTFICFVPLIMLMVYIGNWAEERRSTLADVNFMDAKNAVGENFTNIKMIKMYEVEKDQCERFAKSLEVMENQKTEMKLMSVAALSTGLIWLLLNAAASLIFWFGYGDFHLHDEYCFGNDTAQRNTFFRVTFLEQGLHTPDNGPGVMLLVYFCLMFISLHSLELPNMLTQIQIAKRNATVVYFIIDWKSRINNLSTEGRAPKTSAIGRLDFVNVTFRYPKNPEEIVLNIRYLKIYTGQFIVFAGPPRSGKSTILRLIPRLYDVCSGYVAVDSVNLQNYSVRWLRQQISIITEEPVIFTGTISENILFGKLSANQYDIERACEQAGIHDRIANLPNGYETTISSKDAGDKLTRHEKRQLCLARAYLHKSRFILLDNPLRPEDDEMEPLLLSYIAQVRNTCTIIMASSTVNGLSKRADCVYYMENGSIVEYGTHIQLLKAKGKYFHRLEETINCSLESKKKFDSQLKAYKFSRIIEEKKRSSIGVGLVPTGGFGSFSGGDALGSIGSSSLLPLSTPNHVPDSSKRVSTVLDNLVKLLGGEGKSSKRGSYLRPKVKQGSDASAQSADSFIPHISTSRIADLEADSRGEGQQASRGSTPRRSTFGVQDKQMLIIQSQQKLAMATATLEEAYNRNATNGRRRSSVDNYVAHGFGLMGFQRLNFARPLSNYATQIHKQRHRFLSNAPIFPRKDETQKGLFTTPSKLFPIADNAQKLEEAKKAAPTKSINKLSASQPHVRFSFLTETDNSWPKTGSIGGSSTRLTRTSTGSRNSNGANQYGRSSLMKPKTLRLTGEPPEDILAIAVAQGENLERAVGSLSEANGGDKRESGAKNSQPSSSTIAPSSSLKTMLEADDVALELQEMDTYLAEYQAAVHINAQIAVQGYWCDVFYVCKHDWTYIIPGILASVVLGICYVIQTYTIGRYFHTLESDPSVGSQLTLSSKVAKMSRFVVYIGMLTTAAAFVQEFCFGMAGKRMTRKLREKLFAHILTQDLTWFDDPKHDIGILTFQIYVETAIVHHMLLIVYGIVIQTLTTFIASFALALSITHEANASLVYCFILLKPVLVFLVYYVSKKELTLALDLENRFQPACDFTQEFLTNIVTWISLGAEPHFIVNHKKKLTQEYKWVTTRAVVTTFFNNIVQRSSWVLYGIFVFFTLKQDYSSILSSSPTADESIVSFVLITTELLIYGAFRIGDQLVILGDTEFGKSAAHKLMSILMCQPSVDNANKATTSYLLSRIALENEEPPEITLNNVFCKYQYEDAEDEDGEVDGNERDCLRGINMAIPSGAYVAIVGPPGSGKSSLCNVILRMIDPSFGTIEFNGEDVHPLSPKMIRKGMGLVEYDPCLFGFSINDNIRVGSLYELTDLEMEEATKTAICHYDILDLPNDYRTLVQDMEKSASNFTLKQRISYSRALVRKPKIFIVDDATTSVDTVSDHKLLQVLMNIREKRTLIVFSHKIEPIRDADMIYVLWDGEIVERGTDTRLLNNQGHYYEMYMTQRVFAESMRNSPNQLSTIRYNVKHLPSKTDNSTVEPSNRGVRTSLVGGKIKGLKPPEHTPKRQSSVQFYKFLDEKRKRNEKEKEQRRDMLEKEAKQLEKEAAARENKALGGKEEDKTKEN